MSSPWLLLLGFCVCVLTVVDTLLTARSTAFFTGGFLVLAPRRGGRFATYLLQSLQLDVTFVLGVWLVVLPILARTRLGHWQKLATAALVTLVPAFWFLYVRFQLSRHLGDVLDPTLWLALAGGSPLEWLAQADAQLIPVGAVLLTTFLAAIFLVRALRQRGDRVESGAGSQVPALATLLLGFGLTALASAGVLRVACADRGAGCDVLERKTSGVALLTLFERATDFDLDGAGMFSAFADRAPFDPTRHPFAIDIPGDGIDQNGLAGDHPLDFRAPADEFVEGPKFRRKPNVLVVFLEGVRADMLGAELNGVRVTPVIDALAAEGAHSEHAYANSPYTALSRGQLVGGRLSPYMGQSTWIEDFHANGYEVAWISGEDESFGAEESQMLGIGRTDYHFDARDAIDHSVSRFNTSGSLMISWKTVNQQIERYLDKRKTDRPLFLYVNFGDTHYPYDHAELDDILGVPRLKKLEIRPDDPKGVYQTYANATANVDRAVGELLEMWHAKLGAENSAVIVTSDHGEALFEAGMLGHGLALDATQTRVPLVVTGLGGVWPEPFGLSDLRGALQRSLAEPPREVPSRVRFDPVPGRQILQFLPTVERPRFLCLRGVDGELVYDNMQRRPTKDPRFAPLIWWWESLQLADARRRAGSH